MKNLICLFLLTLLLTSCTFSPQENTPTNSPTPANLIEQESNTLNSLPGSSPLNQANTVPLPSDEDIIRLFFNLIDEGKIPEAIDMMSHTAVPDDSTKQAWGVQFNAFNNVEITKIERFMEKTWDDSHQLYMVTLEVSMSPDSANAPIPYYGFDAKENIRFIPLEKDSKNQWKIASISTGP